MRFEIRFSRDSNLKDSKFYFVQPYHSPKSKRALSVPKKTEIEMSFVQLFETVKQRHDTALTEKLHVCFSPNCIVRVVFSGPLLFLYSYLRLAAHVIFLLEITILL